MEHNRKQKLLIIVALIVGIASLSVGFAAFSVSLNISSSASVTPNSDTFSVKVSTSKDSLVEGAVVPSSNAYNLVTTNGVINNNGNPTISGLSVVFTEPGQVVVYSVYARNEGEYTAYLNNINFLGSKTCTAEDGATDSLVQSACNDINVRVIVNDNLYNETTPITGHSLEKNNADTILIVFEYIGSGARVDGPFSITFSDVALVYSTIDDSSIQPVLPEKLIKLESGDLNTPGSIVSIGDEHFYVIGQEDGNVKLLAMYNLYVGNVVDQDGNVNQLSNPTGIQDSRSRGRINGTFTSIGTTAFSDVEHPEPGRIAYGYAYNYGEYLKKMGVSINETRFITYSELLTLGLVPEYGNIFMGDMWVYDSSYWCEDGSGVYSFYSNLTSPDVTNNTEYGVRPVIEVSLSEFE